MKNQNTPKIAVIGFGEAGSAIFGGSPGEVVSFGNSTAGLGINFQWELDIWGRLLNGRKAAQKNYEAIRQ